MGRWLDTAVAYLGAVERPSISSTGGRLGSPYGSPQVAAISYVLVARQAPVTILSQIAGTHGATNTNRSALEGHFLGGRGGESDL